MPIAAAFSDTKLQRSLGTKSRPRSKGEEENKAMEDGIDQRATHSVHQQLLAHIVTDSY
jgi:hypothetical protein